VHKYTKTHLKRKHCTFCSYRGVCFTDLLSPLRKLYIRNYKIFSKIYFPLY